MTQSAERCVSGEALDVDLLFAAQLRHLFIILFFGTALTAGRERNTTEQDSERQV
jgi:hypothetical protein